MSRRKMTNAVRNAVRLIEQARRGVNKASHQYAVAPDTPGLFDDVEAAAAAEMDAELAALSLTPADASEVIDLLLIVSTCLTHHNDGDDAVRACALATLRAARVLSSETASRNSQTPS